MNIVILGIIVFCTRVIDVSIGTVRTIITVQGRTRTAFVLGFLEVGMWIFVVSAVIAEIDRQPILGLFYALGFSTGNVVGILVERRLAFGHVVLRIISLTHGSEMAEAIRQEGYPVTTFLGEGKSGPVTELYIVVRRKMLESILSILKKIEPDAFYITEQAGMVRDIMHPFPKQPTGWRAILKKK
ncbi:DUF2179 domain-containing protein [bacterium]|nr:DUF2179 domain-containing protein [candidate division CSSED10-310 bacterium]